VYPGQRQSGRRLANVAFGGIPQGSWLREARHGHVVGCAREASVLAPAAMTTATATGLRQAVWKNGPGREAMRASGRGWWKRQWGQAPRVVLATTGVVRGRRRQGVQRVPACHYLKSSVHLSMPCCYSSGNTSRLGVGVGVGVESITMPLADKQGPDARQLAVCCTIDDRSSRLPAVVVSLGSNTAPPCSFQPPSTKALCDLPLAD
jgi:hypothetical protein